MFEAQIFKMYLLGANYGGALAGYSLLGWGGRGQVSHQVLIEWNKAMDIIKDFVIKTLIK